MKHRSAFTLIEILIVIIITAVLTVGLAVSFSGGKALADFKADKAELTSLIQLARNSSLSSVLIDDEYETDHYLLELSSSAASLTAVGYESDGTEHTVELESMTFNTDHNIELDDSLTVYYIPPYGEVCFTYTGGACDYSDGTTSETRILEREDSDQTATFTITIYSGYPEVD